MTRSIRWILSLTLACFAGPALADAAGSILAAEGAVSIVHNGRSTMASPGTSLQSGDIVVTGSDGRAQWLTPDESLMIVAANSRFVIQNYAWSGSGGAGTAKYEITSGGMGALSGFIQSPAYQVTTPAADIAINGTKFGAFFCHANCPGFADGLYVAIIEGQVTTSNSAGSLSGAPGQYIYAANSATAPVFTDRVPPILLSANFDFNFNFDYNSLANIIERTLSPS